MIEDNTPTVTARRRKPTQHLRIRLETARRLQNLTTKTKRRREISKSKRDRESHATLKASGSHPYTTAPRIPKIKKNKLSRPPPPEAKYKKRQRGKTWLPTHVFHAKRAHMTPATEPLWRFAVPVSPTEKSYRPSHRARGARGAVAWDVSYFSTIMVEGTESGLEGMLRGMGVDGEEVWGGKGRKWRAGTRWLQAWVFEREGKRPIAPVGLIRAAEQKDVEMGGVDANGQKTKKGKDRKKVFMRVHPSAFLQLWNELLEVAKRQNPPVMVEDLRFEIGSIEVTGPGATEALIAALQPSTTQTPPAGSPEVTWTSLLGITNPSSLPQNALLAFSVSDPRLRFPCQTLKPPSGETHMQSQAMLLASWPPDQTQETPKLFDRPARLAAARHLPSQKAINRRRTLAGPGNRPASQTTDPQIPVILLASRPTTTAAEGKSTPSTNLPGSWTILLPWKCVLPVWYTLMYYPLSSGGNPRFGGLHEQQQLAFEAGMPWFPGDYPGTRVGWEWGLRERERARSEWERRPKGRRVEFDSLDLGNGRRGEVGRGWACDWERLFLGPGFDEKAAATDGHPEHAKHQSVEDHPPLTIHQLTTNATEGTLHSRLAVDHALATVRIELEGRGTPTPRARIYRLPSDGEASRRWLERGQPQRVKQRNKNEPGLPITMTPEETRRSLADALVASGRGGGHDDNMEGELAIPGEEDLIGFVTTGAYNLAQGKGTGIGSIALSKVPSTRGGASTTGTATARNAIIVRGAGERVGRLGRWEMIH